MPNLKDFYGRATTSLDHVGIWLTGFGLIFTACLFAAKASLFLFQFGWSTAFFIAAAATVIIMLAIAALLAAWRLFRPLSINPAIDAAIDKVADTQRSLDQLHDLYFDLLVQMDGIKAEIGAQLPHMTARIGDAETAMLETSQRLTEANRSLGSVNPAQVLQNICNEMDKIAPDTYGGANSPIVHPNFLGN